MRNKLGVFDLLALAIGGLAAGCAGGPPAATSATSAAAPATTAPAGAVAAGGAGNSGAASGVMSFEAESPDNDFGPSVTKDDEDVGGKASGGHYVGYLGNGADEILRFKKINLAKAGTYTLTIYYMTAEDRGMYVAVNGGDKKIVNFPSTGDYSSATTQPMELKVDLKAGENTIELGNPDGYCPDVDRITLKAAQ